MLRNIIPFGWLVLVSAVAAVFFNTVNLNPKVDDDFFFSSKDPEFQESVEIFEMFPEMSMPIIISAVGDIQSKSYQKKAKQLTEALETLPYSFGTLSITKGPRNIKNAFTSPLWKRSLISQDGKATHFIASIKDVPPETVIPDIEIIIDFFNAKDFKLIVSGPPYIMELIRRNLVRDLKVFSLCALIIFAIVIISVFRSGWVLFGTFTACSLSAMITLFITHHLNFPIGPLTANLSTIVFVLTLSHIAYMTFNWKHVMEHERDRKKHHVWDAVKLTFQPSFWSMLTTFLGFLSCIFVPAIPLRQLGVSGAIGSLTAFIIAYIVFPCFLLPAHKSATLGDSLRFNKKTVRAFFSKKHIWITTLILFISGVAATGFKTINTDPSMLSYFKKETPLRESLDYIDSDGGSSPLKFVIRNKEATPLNTNKVYKQMWNLQKEIEQHPAVGTLLSQPLIMSEAKKRSPVGNLFGWNMLLDAMEKPEYNNITRYFLTKDRTRSLLFLRMKEGTRVESRRDIVQSLKDIIRRNGFVPELSGGIYPLQGLLTQMVINSIFIGLGLLILTFVVMGFAISFSMRVTLALFFSLLIIPASLFGVFGHLKIPIDIISAPAANISIAMGVDAMLHLLIRMKRCLRKDKKGVWDAWASARVQLWKPILSAAVLVCTGFAIFCLSTFPPTQRFGLAIVVGSFMSPLAALFVLPVLAASPLTHAKRTRLKVVQEKQRAA